jgi:hypothetical protein
MTAASVQTPDRWIRQQYLDSYDWTKREQDTPSRLIKGPSSRMKSKAVFKGGFSDSLTKRSIH